MNEAVVKEAMKDQEGLYFVTELMRWPAAAGDLLNDALQVLGQKSWIMAGLEAIRSGHAEDAAAIAAGDYFSTLEAIHTVEAETKVESGQGAMEVLLIGALLALLLGAFLLMLGPAMSRQAPAAAQAIQAISAAQIQPMSDAELMEMVQTDAASCATEPSMHAQIVHGSAAWEAIQACNDPGAKKMVHVNPMTQRKMTGCMLAGKFYIVVDDAEGNNVTATPKDEFRFWDELVRYFRFAGYTR